MQWDDQTSRAARDALSSLQLAETEEFFNDLAGDRNFPGAQSVLVVDYNLLNTPVFGCNLVSEEDECIDIEACLESTTDRLGIIANNKLVLNVRSAMGSPTGKLFIFSSTYLDEIIERIYPDVALTSAETRVLLQVICGYSMKEAAEIDSVSHETKRSQIKSVRQKTGLGRQADISTYTVTRLLMELAPQAPNQDIHRQIRDYHKRYMPSSVRLHILVGESGNQHRVLDMGPADGTAFVVLHPQILPYIRTEDIDLLYRLGIRFIWPLRRGALAPDDPATDFEQYEQIYMEAIHLAGTLILQSEKLTILGVLCGGQYGIKFATMYPDKVSLLVFLSATYSNSPGSGFFALWKNGMLRLTTRNRLVSVMLVKFMRVKLRDKKVFQNFMRRLNSDSKANSKILEYEFASEKRITAMQTRILQSENSLMHDFTTVAFPRWHLLEDIKCRIEFIHGDDDPAHALQDIQQLANSHAAPLHVIADAGHMVYYDHLRPLCKILQNIAFNHQSVRSVTRKYQQAD